MTKWKCDVCGKIVKGYKPTYCCDGRACGCMGLPVEPCICSKYCAEKIFGVPTGDYYDDVKPM